MVPFNEATKGHTIARYIPPKFKIETTRCSCGWQTLRASIKTGKKVQKEPMAAYRGKADQHLYKVWQSAQQTEML